jgi:hypothetical protein
MKPTPRPRPLSQLLSFAIAAVTMLLFAARAVAQDFVPVNDAARPRTNPTPFIAGAYAFIWVAVLLYVIVVARGLGRAKGEIAELQGRIGGLRR